MALANFVEQSINGNIESLFGFICARVNRSPDLINSIRADIGQLVDLLDKLSRLACHFRFLGNLQLVGSLNLVSG